MQLSKPEYQGRAQDYEEGGAAAKRPEKKLHPLRAINCFSPLPLIGPTLTVNILPWVEQGKQLRGSIKQIYIHNIEGSLGTFKGGKQTRTQRAKGNPPEYLPSPEHLPPPP